MDWGGWTGKVDGGSVGLVGTLEGRKGGGSIGVELETPRRKLANIKNLPYLLKTGLILTHVTLHIWHISITDD